MISVPTKIDGYRFVRVIGSGGFSTVFLVQQGNQYYAAKVMPKFDRKKKSNNQNKIDFIEREIKVMQKSSHPNIAYIINLLSDQNNVYIIEEFIQNSLYDLIEEKKKSFMEFTARPIIFQVLNAVSYLHSIGFCHRDIKPQNILIKDDGTIKLIDFGLSTPTNVTNIRCGSKLFFAPEVLLPSKFGDYNNIQSNVKNDKYSNSFNSDNRYQQNQNNLNIDGFKCDSWSCGVTFFLILTGKMPWSKMTIEQITSERINYPPYLSNECIDFLSRLLAIDPIKRITVEEARCHKWILKSKNTLDNNNSNVYSPKDRLPSEKINQFLSNLQLMSSSTNTQLNYSKKQELRNNENDDKNQTSSCYNKTNIITPAFGLSCNKKDYKKASLSSSSVVDDSNSSMDLPLKLSPKSRKSIPIGNSNPKDVLYSSLNCLKNITNKVVDQPDKKAKEGPSSLDSLSIFDTSLREEKEKALNTKVESIFQKINAMKKSMK